MRYRRLERIGISVSECTIGTAGLDRSDMDGSALSEAIAAIDSALEQGVNAFEISAGGRAETIIGEILGRQRARSGAHVFSRVRSLVPFDLPSPHVHVQNAYPGRHIRAETEASLRRLGVERLALQQLHAWCPEWLHEGDWLETLGRLIEEGKIAGAGVSLFDHDIDAGLEVVASGRIDCLQVMHNIFDPGAALALFPLCQKHGVGVIARSPLYYGALSPRIYQPRPFAPDSRTEAYFYGDHLEETRTRVAQLAREVTPPDRTISDLALRFSLSPTTVSTVAIGMTTREHVLANLQALDHGPLDAAQSESLTRHIWLH